MSSLTACIIGFGLDLFIADPRWLYHPVRIIGSLITLLEKAIRKICKSEKALLAGGVVLWFGVVSISAVIPFLVLYFLKKICMPIGFLLEVFWCYQILAAKSLKKESMEVYHALCEPEEPIEKARKKVSMIVGRDTNQLDEEGIVKATVETIAENTSDGVTAPLIFLLIGGVPLGFFYKAVNTMDSMLGYKNEKYLYLGRVAAKIDDAMNYLPARVTAQIMILASHLCGYNTKQARNIYKRDKKNHASPNSAHTEAVCAGALNIRLAGDAYYFGRLYQKPYIGDEGRQIEKEDIIRANKLLYMAAILIGVIGFFIKGMILYTVF